MSKGNCLALLHNQNQENLQRKRKKKKTTSAQTQTKGLKENETSDIFWGFTETNQLREEYEPAQFHPNITHPHKHINFKFERAQIVSFLRDVSIIKRFPPFQKGFLCLDESFEIIYNKTSELNG